MIAPLSATEPIRVLLVADDEDEFVLTKELLACTGCEFELSWARGYQAGLDALERDHVDVALIDYRLGANNGLDVVRARGQHRGGAALILLTGEGDGQIDKAALKAGAVDYLVKGEVTASTLQRTLRYAAQRQRALALVERQAEFLGALINNGSDAIFVADANGVILFASDGIEGPGGGADNCVGRSLVARVDAADDETFRRAFARCLGSSGARITVEYRARTLDGRLQAREAVMVNRTDSALKAIVVTERNLSERVRAEAVARDISARKAAEAAQARLGAIVEATADLVGMALPCGRLLYLNPAGRALIGLDQDVDVTTHNMRDFLKDPDGHLVVTHGVPTAMASGLWRGETEFVSSTGRPIAVSQIILAHHGAAGEVEYLSTIARDITDQQRLERQFFQSQKMEAIGQLAGGVAHDFNNLLTAITGFAELTREQLPPQHPACQDIDQVLKATGTASSLTRQLLAFSRKQLIQPKILDLGTIVDGMREMLARIIGEDVALVMRGGDGLGRVNIDQGQIEQIVLNFAVNARDAMPTGGVLTIETRNVELDEQHAAAQPGMRAGQYVVLTVSDTGCGMDEATRSRIFEPFFTTKARGHGTGLGLSTVYGIVKQNAGSVWVYSEPGVGTTFKVYLPQVDGPVPSHAVERDLAHLGGTETILLVEDQPEVRSVTREILERNGYSVLEAGDGEVAVQTLTTQSAPVQLLVTDVVLPGLSGRVVAERLSRIQPGLPVLYMSGYTDDAIVRHGLLKGEVSFVEKPFTSADFLREVRNNLDRSAAVAGPLTEQYPLRTGMIN